MTVICDYCKKPAKLVDGTTLYPHRRDLAHVQAWRCDPCNADVGCHEGTTKPKGSLAKPQLKALRMAVHRLFDPLWQNWQRAYLDGHGPPVNVMRRIARTRAYAWLTAQMESGQQVHVGEMREEHCERALAVLRAQQPTPVTIREWAKKQGKTK